jgi:membrane protein implicated in regulation of membrane protease activity
MALLDMLIAAYLGWGFYHGRQRGLRAEIVRILGLLIVLAFFLGLGLFAAVRNSLAVLADTLLQRQGLAVTVLSGVVALWIVIKVRRQLRRHREYIRPAREPALYGGIAGVLRALLALGLLLVGLEILLPDFLNRAMVADSMVGQALEMLKGWQHIN